MKPILSLAVAGLLALGASALAEDAPVAKEGGKAPDFKLVGTDGQEYTLKQFAGKKAVVIAWFPKAKTGGCTKECISFREQGEKMREYEVAYFTASCDTPSFNKEFSDDLMLDYPILSDPTRKVAKAYGVVESDTGNPKRWTFFIDKEGTIRYIDKNVGPNVATHGQDVAKKLDELGIPRKKS